MSLVIKNTSTLGYLAFSGSPIIVSLEAESGTYPDGSKVRQAYVEIKTIYRSKSTTHIFKGECDNTEILTLDVSSALRSAMYTDDWLSQLSLTNGDMSSYMATFTVKAYHVYMLNGSIVTGSATTTNGGSVIPGKLTEYERIFMGSSSLPDTLMLSTKPQMMMAPKNHVVLMPYITRNGSSYVYKMLKETCSATPIHYADYYGEDYKVYIDTQHSYFEFLFVNRRGCLEDACCSPLESLSTELSKNEYSLVSIPSYNEPQSLTETRSDIRRSYAMSSGPCSKEWAEWWLTEFLASDKHWMRINNKWIPVSVQPSDSSIELYNSAEPSALHIDFTVTLAVIG